MNRRSAVLVAVAWLLVVSVGAAAVWSVISRAGAGVAGELPVPTTTPEGVAPAPPSSSGTPSGDADESAPITRTWRGEAGSVTASCSAGSVTLVQARPSSGWKVEVDDAGPAVVRVELETADERSRVRVEAACRDGAPVFDVDARDKG